MKRINIISKRKILLGIPLVLVSLDTYFGAIFGYIIARVCSGKEAGCSGRVRSLVLSIKGYKLHLHHWLFGLGIMLFALIFNFSLPFPHFSFGFFGGLVFQGITDYSDWHKILVRKK